MVRYIMLSGFFIVFSIIKASSQNKFACFENDLNKNLKISVSFDKNKRAKFVKYQGQKDSIPIFYSKIIKSKNPGGIPAVYWEEIYLEKYKGKVTGEYTFTNAGTYQLDLTYSRRRDNKEFYFAIIGNTVGNDGQPFRINSCF
jgi:hypothetical protein